MTLGACETNGKVGKTSKNRNTFTHISFFFKIDSAPMEISQLIQ